MKKHLVVINSYLPRMMNFDNVEFLEVRKMLFPPLPGDHEIVVKFKGDDKYYNIFHGPEIRCCEKLQHFKNTDNDFI